MIFGKTPALPVTTVTTSTGSASATVTSATGLIVGQVVNASTIPAGDYITAVSGTAITLHTGTGVTAGTSVPMAVTSVLLNSSFTNGINGSELDANVTGSGPCWNMSAIGDINGDGIGDVIIAAGNASPGGSHYEGSVYVYFGRKYGWPTTAFGLNGL